MAHSKIGKAMYIRVSPKNCMAIADALKVAGLHPGDFTFSSATARVLDMLLAGLLRDGIVPTRDGFEFSSMMNEFIQQNKAALPSVSYKQPTQAVNHSQGQVNHSQVAMPKMLAVGSDYVEPSAHPGSVQRRAAVRFKELMTKKEHAPDSWTAEDAAELEGVMEKL